MQWPLTGLLSAYRKPVAARAPKPRVVNIGKHLPERIERAKVVTMSDNKIEFIESRA